jgi:hypothetical protein
LKRRLLFCLIVFSLCFGVKNANAAYTYTWIGANNANWDNAGSWYNNTNAGAGGYPGSSGTGDIANIYSNTTITYRGTASANSIASINSSYVSVTINMVNATGAPALTITNGITTANYAYATFAITASTSGTVTVNGGGISVGGGDTFSVGTGVTMNLSNGSLTQAGGAITFSNAGTITTNSFPISFTTNGGNNSFTNNGTITANSNMDFDYGNFTNGGTITAQNATTFTILSNTYSFTNTGTININPNTALTANSSFVFSGSGLTFNNTSPGQIKITGISGNTTTLFTISPNTSTITNTGTISATNAPILWNANVFSSIGNPGSITLVSSPLTITNGTTLTNTGTISATNSNLNLSTSTSQAVTFNNTSPGVLLMSGSTLTYPGNNAVFTNTGTVTANASSSFMIGAANSSGTQLKNSGIFNAGTSNSPCTIQTATTSSQIAISNTGTFNVGSTSYIWLSDALTSNPSTISNSGSGVFTLESDQYGSASIGPSGTPTGTGTGNINQFTGNFNVQRYITGTGASTAYRGYRLLSSPINISANTVGAGNTSLSFINAPATVVNPNAVAGTKTYYGIYTGGRGSGFSTVITNPTVYIYNETLLKKNTSFTNGKNIGIYTINTAANTFITAAASGASSGTTYSLPVGNGYLVYYAGSTLPASGAPSNTPDAATITNIGTINQQSILVNLWYTPGGATSPTTNKLSYSAAPDGINYWGYNMMGNPYPCTIYLPTVYSDNSGSISSNFYELYNQNPSNGYIVYSATGGTSDAKASPYIVSGQGFFVVASGANKAFTFKETQKVYNNSLIPGSSTTSPTLVLASQYGQTVPGGSSATANSSTSFAMQSPASLKGLHLQISQDSIVNNSCGIYFKSTWADKFDIEDAGYLSGATSVFMSSYTTDGYKTAINKLADFTKNKVIKLNVAASADGQYHLTLTDFQNIDTTIYNIYLRDNLKKDSLDIARYKTYLFDMKVSDTASFSNRFELAIERKQLPPYQLISFTAQKVKEGVLLTWKTYNEGDFTGFGLQKQNGSSTLYNSLYSTQSSGISTYSYIDRSPVKGNNTYRLMQNDIDNVVTYTNPLNVLYDGTTASVTVNVLTVYPNPAKELITVNYNTNVSSGTSDTYTANIYNSTGGIMLQKKVNSNSWLQDITSFLPGTYLIEIKSSNGSLIGNSKFVKYQ